MVLDAAFAVSAAYEQSPVYLSTAIPAYHTMAPREENVIMTTEQTVTNQLAPPQTKVTRVRWATMALTHLTLDLSMVLQCANP